MRCVCCLARIDACFLLGVSLFFLFSALYAVLLITFFLQAFLIPYFHFRSGDGVAGGTNINIIKKYN
jgi:hypothetical protein